LNKKDQQKYKDFVTNKVLLAFTVGVAMIMILLNIFRMMSKILTFSSARTATDVLFIASCVVAGLGMIKFIVEKSLHRDVEFKLFTGATLIVIGLFCAACFGVLSLRFDPSTFTMLYGGIPAAVMLYIIYYSFDPAFFIVSLLCVVGSCSAWLIYKAIQSVMKVWFAIPIGVAFILLLTLVLIGVIASFKRRPIHLLGYNIEFLPSKNNNGVIIGAMIVALFNVCATVWLAYSDYLFDPIYLLMVPAAYFVISMIYFAIVGIAHKN